MTAIAKAAGLLVCSNLFMTAEHVLQVPANRIGYGAASAYQLKILQEAITFLVFGGFAWLWLGEPPEPRYVVAGGLMVTAVAIAFR